MDANAGGHCGDRKVRIQIPSNTSYRGRNSRTNLPALALFVLLALGIGALGAMFSPRFSPGATQWYAMLAKPEWLPPARWFGPIWIALYLLMGIAAWIVWRERYHRSRTTAIFAYGLQLLLNGAWAPLFFGMRNIDAGLFDVVALLMAIGWTLREFARVKAGAAWLLAPYFLWVCVAVAMNLSLWKLNP
jgi:tryptophan-rich sensory protein